MHRARVPGPKLTLTRRYRKPRTAVCAARHCHSIATAIALAAADAVAAAIAIAIVVATHATTAAAATATSIFTAATLVAAPRPPPPQSPPPPPPPNPTAPAAMLTALATAALTAANLASTDLTTALVVAAPAATATAVATDGRRADGRADLRGSNRRRADMRTGYVSPAAPVRPRDTGTRLPSPHAPACLPIVVCSFARLTLRCVQRVVSIIWRPGRRGHWSPCGTSARRVGRVRGGLRVPHGCGGLGGVLGDTSRAAEEVSFGFLCSHHSARVSTRGHDFAHVAVSPPTELSLRT